MSNTRPSYPHKACSCEICLKLRRRISKLRKIYGSQWRDATPAKERVQAFHGEGFSIAAMAAGMGVGASTVQAVLHDDRRFVHAQVAEKILAATRDDIFNAAPERSLVPSVGATRRLKALSRMGWQLEDLSANGSEVHRFRSVRLGRDRQIRAATHRRVVELYDKHSMDVGPAQKSVMVRVQKRGYAPPLAWDDIDDPAARPNLDGFPDQDLRNRLYEDGASDAEIARETGVSPESVRRWRQRHGLKSNYAPRGRTA